MPKFNMKSCENPGCDSVFMPTGPAARFCQECAAEIRKARNRDNSQRFRIAHGLVEKPGVGKGGNNRKGHEDSQYTTGIGGFMNIRRVIKEQRRYCNRCDKDLIDAGRYEWVVHHIDHDRTNNSEDNFELLCKRCHQVEHECHTAFERAETI